MKKNIIINIIIIELNLKIENISNMDLVQYLKYLNKIKKKIIKKEDNYKNEDEVKKNNEEQPTMDDTKNKILKLSQCSKEYNKIGYKEIQ